MKTCHTCGADLTNVPEENIKTLKLPPFPDTHWCGACTCSNTVKRPRVSTGEGGLRIYIPGRVKKDEGRISTP